MKNLDSSMAWGIVADLVNYFGKPYYKAITKPARPINVLFNQWTRLTNIIE